MNLTIHDLRFIEQLLEDVLEYIGNPEFNTYGSRVLKNVSAVIKEEEMWRNLRS
jgi:hypothetical protein